MPETIKDIHDIIVELAGEKGKKIIQYYKDNKGRKIEPVDPFKAYEKEVGQVAGE
jgi:hypothetical protein